MLTSSDGWSTSSSDMLDCGPSKGAEREGKKEEHAAKVSTSVGSTNSETSPSVHFR